MHEAQLAEWRAAATAALQPRSRRERKAASIEQRRIRDLEREVARKDEALAEAAALLVLKKSPGDLGGRGRRHGPEERRVIRELVEEAVAAGARRWRACEVLGLTARTLERWGDADEDGRHGPNTVPANKLSDPERKKLVEIATSPEFRDHSPSQIVPRLADRCEYVASESTFHRVLRDQNMQHHRGRSRPPVSRPHEHVADRAWQVGSWDITYLRSHVRGQFFYLYLVEDVWSRKILGWEVHDLECNELAAALIERIRRENPGVDLRGWVLTRTTADR